VDVSVDSIVVFEDEDKVGIMEGTGNVTKELRSRRGLRLVLLDDFFGTNKLRQFDVDPLDGKSKSYFVLNLESLWLQALENGRDEGGCTLVITGRSVLLTITEIPFGLSLREQAISEIDVLTGDHRYGFFRVGGEQRIKGTFDDTSLLKAAEKTGNSTRLTGALRRMKETKEPS